MHAFFFLGDITKSELTRIAGMMQADELIPHVGAILPRAAARTAHEMLAGMRTRPRGKIGFRMAA